MKYEQFSPSQKREIFITTPTPYNAQFQFCNFLTAYQGINLLSTNQKLFNNALMLSVCEETSFEKIY